MHPSLLLPTTMHFNARPLTRLATVGLASSALVGMATAQGFGNEWVEFQLDPAQLADVTVSSNQLEVDFDWGDLDGDGWTDLVVVRKEPFTSPGKRPNLLLMNEQGTLVDRTQEYATASDAPMDRGFFTFTNDRDVVLTDVDLDGLLDVVTATTISDGDPKHIGHPRVYMNLGHDQGQWLGIRNEDARIPQLFHFGTGLPENPRFCSVAAGDLTNDGYPELYFGDYDSSGAGGVQQPADKDMNDRLLVNDGNGYFTDESQSRMSPTMLLSAFGMASVIADLNGDGHNDVLKDTALNPPQYIAASYNNPANPGFFQVFDDFHVGFAPYHVNVGDLNNDGRLDIVESDDNLDRFRLNEGNDQFGRVIWSQAYTYSFLSQDDDDGFASNNYIADLDNDGWADAIYADVDVDIPGGNRRMHIYHNVFEAAGEPIMVEERETSGAGWVSAKGFTVADLQGTHDFAIFDIDRDGDKDMVIGRIVGTSVWLNQLDPEVCQEDLGFGGPGNVALSFCGETLLEGNQATLAVASDLPSAPGVLAVSTDINPTPLLGGTIAALPADIVIPIVTDGAGDWQLPITVGSASATLTLQAILLDASQAELFAISNAVLALFN